jgi:hypothetical protein
MNPEVALARALIVTDEDPVMSYFEFTGVICQLNTALQVIMQIVHSIRMATTEPYG